MNEVLKIFHRYSDRFTMIKAQKITCTYSICAANLYSEITIFYES